MEGCQPALLNTDSEREGECSATSTNLYINLFQQITAGGSFGKEQHEDDRLWCCWS